MFREVFRHIAGTLPLHQLISVNHIVQIKNRASDTITKMTVSVNYLRLILHVHLISKLTMEMKLLKQLKTWKLLIPHHTIRGFAMERF